MPFFNRNWGGAYGGCWAGPTLLAGWIGGCRIVWAVEDHCFIDLWILIEVLPCKNKEEGGTARASLVAAPMPKSVPF